jgi:hypothetical protein
VAFPLGKAPGGWQVGRVKTAEAARRRWFGLLFLILAGGMLIWGLTFLGPHLRRWGFIIYWSVCFVFTGLAVLIALLDLMAVRRAALLERRRLLGRAAEEMAARVRAEHDHGPEPAPDPVRAAETEDGGST